MSGRLQEILKDVTSDILETMFFVVPEPWSSQDTQGEDLRFDIRGVVALGGSTPLWLNLFVPMAMARRLAGNFLGLEESRPDADSLLDTTREILNMIAGNLVTELEAESGLELGLPEVSLFQRTVPRAYMGEHKHVFILVEDEYLMLSFTREGS